MVGRRWIRNGMISSEYYACYVYGIELIVSEIIGISIILFLGAVTGTYSNAFVFLLVFILVRQYTGGFHADSYLSCNIFFSISYIVNMLIVAHIEVDLYVLTVLALIIGIGIISIIGPVTHKNKRIDETLRNTNKVRSFILYIGCCLVSVGIAASHRSLALTIIIALLQIIMLMVVERIRKRGRNNEKVRGKIKGSCN
ncbi:MAG: accessory gene regulator B family protein [Hungatella sp.]|jgi:accessory gene regulator B|nr:accessory gene regulator B family protein [Hungatella sp.]